MPRSRISCANGSPSIPPSRAPPRRRRHDYAGAPRRHVRRSAAERTGTLDRRGSGTPGTPRRRVDVRRDRRGARAAAARSAPRIAAGRGGAAGGAVAARSALCRAPTNAPVVRGDRTRRRRPARDGRGRTAPPGQRRRVVSGPLRWRAPLAPGGRGVAVSRPGRRIPMLGLMAPSKPARPHAARKQFGIVARAAGLDNRVLLVGFARVLPLARGKEIYHAAAGLQRACVLASNTEQQQFGYITKIEPDAAPVRAPVLAHLVPDHVGFVTE